MTVLGQPALLSPEDFLAGEMGASGRHEYLNGVAYAMVGGTLRHSRIVMNLYRLLLNQLFGKPCEVFHSDTMIKAQIGSDLRFYYPDASIICQPSKESAHVQESPKVLFEVLSPSTSRVDEGEKLHSYREIPTVEAYLIIASEIPRVTLWKRASGQWEVEHFTKPEEVIQVACIGCQFRLADLYTRVAFE